MNKKTLNSWALNCLQPERRLHITSTTQEMFQVSALLYGGISGIALFALIFPAWPELNQLGILISASLGLFLASLFYFFQARAPLWLAVIHIPFGVVLASIGIYLGQSEQSIGFSVIYVLSSAYLFHYHTKIIAIVILIIAMVAFTIALYLIGVTIWPAIIIFIFGTCFLMGTVVWQITHRMHQLNIRDALTGLYNRQTINALTQDLLNKNDLNPTRFEFIMIDLNKFKAINDSLGHLKGDQVLIQFSRALEHSVDKNDYVARWGGDEFIVILKDTTPKKRSQFEIKLREKTQNIIGFELGYSQPQKGDSLDTLMHRADQNMYAKKHHRRATD